MNVKHETHGPSDYEEITRQNEVRLGTDRASRMSQVSMYADTAHFIYELLQNADDARATEIEFTVTQDSLIIEHDGRDFTTTDVENISYFGKGKTDKTKIGHFGLGFKSVFAYTASPRVHSGVESFEIRDLYSLAPTPRPADLPNQRTRFVLPFDHDVVQPTYIEPLDRKSPSNARDEIAAKLTALESETLLFTASLREIRWCVGNNQGSYRRDARVISPGVRELSIVDRDGDAVSYLVFERQVRWPDGDDRKQSSRRPVEIAFLLSASYEHGGQVEPFRRPLFVFFATTVDANVEFILQGPYRTTPARDNVPRDDPFNQFLISVSAELLIEALRWLRDRNLLTLDSLITLPLTSAEGFEALHTAVRQALTDEPLLPAAEGSYVSAATAKLARGAQLPEIFSSDQLSLLFGRPDLRWIHPELTADGQYSALHTFLAGKKRVYLEAPVPGLVKEIQVGAEDIARRVDESFMASQSDEWITQLYAYLSDGGPAEFRRRPIIRLADGTHVRPFSEDGVPNAFLPTDVMSNDVGGELPFVHAPLTRYPPARQFLEETLHLTSPDICDVVMKNVLPHFRSEQPLSREEWRRQFAHIRAALQAPPSQKQTELKDVLRNERILFAEVATAPAHEVFVEPTRAYFTNDDTQTFFASGAGHLLPSDEYEPFDFELLRDLGVADRPRVAFKEPDKHGNVIISAKHSRHSRGLSGFDPDWTIDGLDEALQHINPSVAQLLWIYLLPLTDRQLIRGTIESSPEQYYKDPDRKTVEAQSGRLIREREWLPAADGTLRLPAEMKLGNLPEGFEKGTDRARKLAKQLGMSLPRQVEVLEDLFAGDEEKLEIVDLLRAADPSMVRKMRKLFPSEPTAPAPTGTFREAVQGKRRPQRDTVAKLAAPGPISNPTRYAEKVEEELRETIRELEKNPASVRMQVLSIAPSNADARAFLYAQYEGRCQVTGSTFTKADGTNYFVAFSLASRIAAAHLNHAGNMLCLSAETAAKVTHGTYEWVDDFEEKISIFRSEAEGGTLSNRQMRIRIIGEEHLVTWTEHHFMRLIKLWKLG